MRFDFLSDRNLIDAKIFMISDFSYFDLNYLNFI